MQTLILHAFAPEDEFAHRVLAVLTDVLSETGSNPTIIDLSIKNVADCTGCFRCWTETPGECYIKDDAPAVTIEMAKAERLVLFCPVVFGGFSPDLKRILERSISILLPFMRVFHNEMHHNVRYDKHYQLCGVGILDTEDTDADTTFRKRVQRFSLNFNGRHYCAGTIIRNNGQNIDLLLRGLLQNTMETKRDDQEQSVGASIPLLPEGSSTRVTSALMICGSPKGTKGTSWALGSYLMRQLQAQGIVTKSRGIYPRESLIADVKNADLLILSFPLYGDGLPARFKATLKDIAIADVGSKLCAALVQCGFIESQQNETAIEMCRLFARDAGFIWLGGLGRGGGGMLAGKPLEQAPAPFAKTREALGIAAEYLAQGTPIPAAATNLFRVQLIPRWLYAVSANLGFTAQSIKNGRLFSIWRTPY